LALALALALGLTFAFGLVFATALGSGSALVHFQTLSGSFEQAPQPPRGPTLETLPQQVLKFLLVWKGRPYPAFGFGALLG